MSSMGELTFFLGLQVKQKEDGIFISQDKYVAEILKKFDFASVKTASTPIETQKPLVKDEEATDVDVHLYRSMIGSLMYLTASRPDIMFAVCACSRKLTQIVTMPGANSDRKTTTGGCQFLTGDIYFMAKQEVRHSGKLLLQRQNKLLLPTAWAKDGGEASERPSQSQPIPSPSHPRNEDGLTLQSVYDLCVSLCKQVTIQAKEIKDLKAQLKKLKKKARPGRKTAKSKPTAHKDQTFDVAFDDLDAMDYMDTEDAHNEKGVITEDQVSTMNPDERTYKTKVSTDQLNVSTDKLDEGTAKPKNGNSNENANPTATPIVFGDDETIAEFLVSMSQNKAKQKGVEIKDSDDIARPRTTSTRSVLTLKPLQK
ncbi:uncharacterized mitochondrial protein-like protein [Tanacetum coccineum]